MATTRIFSMHVNKGATVAQCLSDRTDYAKNPEKTDGGAFISSYGCDPHTADAEFLFQVVSLFFFRGQLRGGKVFLQTEVTARKAAAAA